jgi:hypothetical protein
MVSLAFENFVRQRVRCGHDVTFLRDMKKARRVREIGGEEIHESACLKRLRFVRC